MCQEQKERVTCVCAFVCLFVWGTLEQWCLLKVIGICLYKYYPIKMARIVPFWVSKTWHPPWMGQHTFHCLHNGVLIPFLTTGPFQCHHVQWFCTLRSECHVCLVSHFFFSLPIRIFIVSPLAFSVTTGKQTPGMIPSTDDILFSVRFCQKTLHAFSSTC